MVSVLTQLCLVLAPAVTALHPRVTTPDDVLAPLQPSPEPSIQHSLRRGRNHFMDPHSALHHCTPKGGCWPTLFIIGAQKCATTSIYRLLQDNHAVCGHIAASKHEAKEAHFWDNTDLFEGNWSGRVKDRRHIDEYLMGYPKGICKGPFMDATPSYLRDYNSAARMALAFPTSLIQKEARFLAVLREPIARDLSFYNMFRGEWVKAGSKHDDVVPSLGPISWNLCGSLADIERGVFPSYEQAVTCEVEKWDRCVLTAGDIFRGYRKCCLGSVYASDVELDRTRLADGMYSAQLKKYSLIFPRKHIMVINFDTLVDEQTQERSLSNVLTFFGLTAYSGPMRLEHENAWHFDGKVSAPSCSLRDRMAAIYEKWNEHLYKDLDEAKAQGLRPDMEPDFSRFVIPECDAELDGVHTSSTATAQRSSKESQVPTPARHGQ